MPERAAPPEFIELLKTLVARFETRSALGALIHMSGSRVGRALAGQYAFNVENCLRLAEATGESPSVVLRAAGKWEVAACIERLYGRERARVVSEDQRQLLDLWETLAPSKREAFRTLMRETSAHEPVPARTRRAGKK